LSEVQLKWRKCFQADFHFDCLRKGHRPEIIRSSFSMLYVKCSDCGRVWRFHVCMLEWAPLRDFEEFFVGVRRGQNEVSGT